MIILLNGKYDMSEKLAIILSDRISNSIIINSKVLENTLKKMVGIISSECFYSIISNIAAEVVDKKNKNLILAVEIKETYKLREFYDNLKEISWNVYKVSVENNMGKLELQEIADNIIESIYGDKDEFFNKEFLREKSYIVKTNKINLKAANSSHQTLSDIQKVKDVFEIKLQTHPLIIRQELELENLDKYLQVDEKLKIKNILENVLSRVIEGDSYNKSINKMVNSIRDLDIYEDESIYGERKTNMFIGCMRYIGVPTKYVLGKSRYHNYQAWAETYIKTIGWVPVDVVSGIPSDEENWYFGITNNHIKLFEGVNLEEIDINLKDFESEVYDISNNV